MIMENFDPACSTASAQLGKDPRRSNPKIVMGSTTGFGSTGPYSDFRLRERRAGDGRRDEKHYRRARRAAVRDRGAIGDSGHGLHLAIGLSPRCGRRTARAGPYVEVAMMDGVMNLCR